MMMFEATLEICQDVIFFDMNHAQFKSPLLLVFLELSQGKNGFAVC